MGSGWQWERKMRQHNYYVYILTNKHKNVLYVGVTNNIMKRLYEHTVEKSKKNSFTVKYNCEYLVYYEHQISIEQAIARETEIKKRRREKKDKLINSVNPEWNFLNEEVMAW